MRNASDDELMTGSWSTRRGSWSRCSWSSCPVVVLGRRVASWVVGRRVVGGRSSRRGRRGRVQGRHLGGAWVKLRLGSRDLAAWSCVWARGRRRLAWSWLLAACSWYAWLAWVSKRRVT